ncbi:MAG: YbjQ family protein [Alphaproteobacteria bacterium]|nr:YbjQ family protein [Alphaproteobacteria bacterium]
MIITTTDSVPGKEVAAILGVVAGEAVLGVNMFRDLFAGLRDIVGGRSGGYQKALREARDHALDDLMAEAKALGADAVIGLDLDYETIGGQNNSMLMVSANGTAVRLR